MALPSNIATKPNQGVGYDEVPTDPNEALGYFLTRYRLINPKTPEDTSQEVEKFLSKGKDIEVPQTMSREGGKIPFRLGPYPSYNIINACIKILEKTNEKELEGELPEDYEQQRLVGLMCLADQLFQSASSTLDGHFTLHNIKYVEGRRNSKGGPAIVLNEHGQSLKKLVNRLEKYRIAKIEMARRRGVKIDLPMLSARSDLTREIRESQAKWNLINPNQWDGKKPWELQDSLESYRERGNIGEAKQHKEGESEDDLDRDFNQDGINESFESVLVEDAYSLGGFPDSSQEPTGTISQAQWLGLDDLGEDLTIKANITKGNVLSEDPQGWIWNNEKTPLEYIVDYICSNAKTSLEEAQLQITNSIRNPNYRTLGSLALLVDSKNKTSPNNYWKLIRRISNQFYSNRKEEPSSVLKKLDCARFTLCLNQVNQEMGINPNQFRLAFYAKVFSILSDPKKRETTTRNEILLETLKESPEFKEKGWSKIEADKWLEHLQSSGIGAYENSKPMELERERLLARLNHLFQTPREELQKAENDPTYNTTAIENIQTVLSSASNAFYTYLTGKTGQMTRRELRTKIQALKEYALTKGDQLTAKRMEEMGKFVSSISKQVKEGTWYEKEKENKTILFDFLLGMLKLPRKGKLEFPGSQAPAPKDPLEISLDFLKTYADEYIPAGSTTIEDIVSELKEYENQEAGGQLSKALTKISKTQNKRYGKRQTLVEEIEDRRETLQSAIEIANSVHDAEDSVKHLNFLVSKEIQILKRPQTLQKEDNQEFKKNLYFWKGLHYLAQNIQSRKEPEKYQISPTGRGTLQNLIAIAKAKIKNKELVSKGGNTLKQFVLKKTRERTLGSNITVPIALWLEEPTKGTKTPITHDELVKSFEDRLEACSVCIEACQNESDIEIQTIEFEEKARIGKAQMNALALSECISMLEEPPAIVRAIEWERANKKEAISLGDAHPELDTPNKKIEYLSQNQKVEKAEIKDIPELVPT